jgi:dihydropteroate synthase
METLDRLLRHNVLLFSAEDPSLPDRLGSLPSEWRDPGRGDVVAWIEALDLAQWDGIRQAPWEVPVGAYPGSAGGERSCVLVGTRRSLAALARRPATGTAGQALTRALELPPVPVSCRVMGVLNVTPDSFSDGGDHAGSAVERAVRLVAEGADIIDVGGESTRPGAIAVPEDVELERVLPVVRELAKSITVPISVDTSRASVARAALAEGARIVNDVSGLRRDPSLAKVVAAAGADLVLMHSRGTPQDMQSLTAYDRLVVDVARELGVAVRQALHAGVDPARILVDPGIGFAKTGEQNLELLRHLGAFTSLGFPLVVGVSRKAFLGRLTGRENAKERGPASLAAGIWAVLHGAQILRVHDVAETRDALLVLEGIRGR